MKLKFGLLKKKKAGRRLFFFFLFILILYLFVTQSDYINKLIYPFHYRETIIEESQKNGLDPLLVAAVIWVESRFNEDAESAKGARGLMQVMPQTGEWAAEQMNIPNYSTEMLYDPAVNIAIGTWYLRELSEEFDGNIYAVLAAYNGGRTHVKRWLEYTYWDGSGENISDIPFPETRDFVVKVVRVYQRYENLYSQETPTQP